MKVGDKVICVDDKNFRTQGGIKGVLEVEFLQPVVQGKEYIIRKLTNEGRGICVEGVVGGYVFLIGEEKIEIGFASRRFRKQATHPNFKSEISKKLANTPLIEEKVEKIKEKEPETV